MANLVRDVPVQLFVGERRNSNLYLDEQNFIYKINKKRSNSHYFIRCYEASCIVTGTLNTETLVVHVSQSHNHYCQIDYVKKCTFLNNIKNRARLEETVLKTIYDEEADRFPDTDLPFFHKLQSTMLKARQSRRPKCPRTFDEHYLAARSIGALADGSKFIVEVSSVNSQKNIIFLSPGIKKEIMKDAQLIYLDATFKVIPNAFYQLLTLHIEDYNRVYPVAYVLMERKTEEAYKCVFEKFREMMPNFNPAATMSDYETGLSSAVEAVFPGVRNTGCWFHYSQAVWRKVQNVGLVRSYKNGIAKNVIKTIMALPLLPAENFDEGLEAINNLKELLQKPAIERLLDKLINYIKEFWIIRITPNRMSVNGRERRTNNDVESFYSMMKKKFGTRKPNMYVFMEKLIAIENASQREFNHQRRSGGTIPVLQSRAQRNSNNKIKSYSAQLANGIITVAEFLSRVKHQTPEFSKEIHPRSQLENVQDPESIIPVDIIAGPSTSSLRGSSLEESVLQTRLNEVPDAEPQSDAFQLIQNENVEMFAERNSFSQFIEQQSAQHVQEDQEQNQEIHPRSQLENVQDPESIIIPVDIIAGPSTSSLRGSSLEESVLQTRLNEVPDAEPQSDAFQLIQNENVEMFAERNSFSQFIEQQSAQHVQEDQEQNQEIHPRSQLENVQDPESIIIPVDIIAGPSTSSLRGSSLEESVLQTRLNEVPDAEPQSDAFQLIQNENVEMFAERNSFSQFIEQQSAQHVQEDQDQRERKIIVKNIIRDVTKSKNLSLKAYIINRNSKSILKKYTGLNLDQVAIRSYLENKLRDREQHDQHSDDDRSRSLLSSVNVRNHNPSDTGHGPQILPDNLSRPSCQVVSTYSFSSQFIGNVSNSDGSLPDLNYPLNDVLAPPEITEHRPSCSRVATNSFSSQFIDNVSDSDGSLPDINYPIDDVTAPPEIMEHIPSSRVSTYRGSSQFIDIISDSGGSLPDLNVTPDNPVPSEIMVEMEHMPSYSRNVSEVVGISDSENSLPNLNVTPVNVTMPPEIIEDIGSESSTEILPSAVSGNISFEGILSDSSRVSGVGIINRMLSESSTESEINGTQNPDNICIICKSRRRTLMSRPCNHFHYCGKCADRILRGSDRMCSLCRVYISKFERIFG